MSLGRVATLPGVPSSAGPGMGCRWVLRAGSWAAGTVVELFLLPEKGPAVCPGPSPTSQPMLSAEHTGLPAGRGSCNQGILQCFALEKTAKIQVQPHFHLHWGSSIKPPSNPAVAKKQNPPRAAKSNLRAKKNPKTWRNGVQ